MQVVFEAEVGCPGCAHAHRAIQWSPVRVNKGSLVTTGVSLGAIPRFCERCKAEMPDAVPTCWRLDDESQKKVDAYRVKHGWPVAA